MASSVASMAASKSGERASSASSAIGWLRGAVWAMRLVVEKAMA